MLMEMVLIRLTVFSWVHQLDQLEQQIKLFISKSTTGNSTGGVVVYSETFNYNFNYGPSVTQYRLTTPPTLTRGSDYVVAYAFASGAGLSHLITAMNTSGDVVTNSPTISPPGAGGSATVSFSDATVSGSSPWNQSNGTSTVSGQFPLISISI